MRFFSAWLLAFSALGCHRLRTLLTMLGITIGIASVICTIALGEGGSRLIQQQLLIALIERDRSNGRAAELAVGFANRQRGVGDPVFRGARDEPQTSY